MADDGKKSESGLPSGGIFWLVLLGAGALFLRQVPWEGTRPVVPEIRPYSYAAVQDVDARLWQDPIGAVARGREAMQRRMAASAAQKSANPQPRHTAADVADSLQARRCKPTDVLVLGVMVGGGPYPELVEARRRARYAILAGLNETGFVPEDEEHLGYFEPNFPNSPPGKETIRLPEFIAYEWMVTNESAPSASPRRGIEGSPGSGRVGQNVLVLWLDEDIFGRDTRAQIAAIAATLDKPCAGKPASGTNGDIRYAILGPSYTWSLQMMISDAAARNVGNQKKELVRGPDVAYYAYGPTAEDHRMLANVPTNQGEAVASVHEYFRTAGIPLFRTIGTDDKLAKKLRDELELRNVKPFKNTVVRDCPPSVQGGWAHVVLIAEWDSFYGRSLPRTIAGQFAGDFQCTGNHPGDFPPWVHSYSYLRGLDGQQPPSQSGGESGNAKKNDGGGDTKSGGSDRGSDSKLIERPEGQGQFDYLRRLTDQLVVLNDDLRAQHRGSIKAIGVLGSDVYDKLLILQAIREQFPNALVFTTDIDARMLHPQQLDWTHNAIVASSFGLRLGPQLQRDIPPFRDSYQTSLYLSTMLAVNHARRIKLAGNACQDIRSADESKCFGITQSDISTWLASPRVFEIGRKSAFDFSAGPDRAQLEGGGNASKWPADDPRPRFQDVEAVMTPQARGGRALCHPDELDTCSYVHPLPSRMYPEPSPTSMQVVFRLFVGALLLLGLATGKWSQFGAWIVHHRHSRASIAARGGAAALLLGLVGASLYYVDTNAGKLWHQGAEFLTEGGRGEPIALLAGVSTWPTEFIRALALLLTLWFIFRGWRDLDRNLDEISTQMMWQPERDALMRELHDRHQHWNWWIRMARMFSFRLGDQAGGRINPETGMQPYAELFWQKYIYQGRWWARLSRVLLVTIIYHMTFRFIGQLMGGSMTPYRGKLLVEWNHDLIVACVFAMQFLLFSVVDATVFCHQMVSSLRHKIPRRPVDDPAVATGGESESRWPQRTLDHYAAKLQLDRKYLDDWIAMHFVARRTHTVARLVYYPFIVISLLVLSRSTVFDNWGMSTFLVVALSCSVLIVIGCAIALRAGAESLRRAAIWRLTNAKILLSKDDVGKHTANQIDVMIGQIRAFNTGAFAPYSQQPLVRALLLPLTSFGGSTLVEYLSIANF